MCDGMVNLNSVEYWVVEHKSVKIEILGRHHIVVVIQYRYIISSNNNFFENGVRGERRNEKNKNVA